MTESSKRPVAATSVGDSLASSSIGTFVLTKLIGLAMRRRVDVETEITGLDQAMHRESADELADAHHAASGRGPATSVAAGSIEKEALV